MRVWKQKQRLVAVALAVALLASLSLGSASGLAVVEQEMLANGNFEDGFSFVPGCGSVGVGWKCFTNDGSVAYGFYDDQWAPVVADGSHSQLIAMSTFPYAASEANRYAGIYQTVQLVKGSTYQFRIRGAMREETVWPDDDPWRYRVQWSYTADGSADWTKVTNWAELPWDKIDQRSQPTGLESFATSFTAPSDKITLFVRVWKKWGHTNNELDVNIDAISLWGASVRKGGVVVVPTTPVAPAQPAVLACGGTNLVANAGFEGGFVDGIPRDWTAFTNGGQAGFGFYDEMWKPVVKEGTHSLLMEINTYGLAASQNDRYAGVLQVVSGLTQGATYEISMWGMLREEAAHPDEDRFRYRVQWGFVPADSSPSWTDITTWTELPWDEIHLRTEPGSMSFFSTQFTAPSSKVVLAVRAWKKWPTVQRELDVNIDAIRLVRCTTTTTDAVPVEGQCFWYKVERGDTLYGIALKYNDSIAGLVERNEIANPNKIFSGQKLLVCGP